MEGRGDASARKKGWRLVHALYLLLLGLPLALYGELTHRDTLAFLASGAALIPLAYVIGLATEAIAVRLGTGLGTVVLAALSNSVELLIGLLALSKGLVRVVQAAITGSILANILLVLGSAMFAGGVRFRKQDFGSKAANMQGTVLFLAALALFLPTLAAFLVGKQVDVGGLSLWIAGGLLVTYVLGLVFSLGTHRHLFTLTGEGALHPAPRHEWSTRKALIVLGLATLGAAASAELLTRSIEGAARAFGWTDLFVGAIVLAIVSNAAEHASSVTLALKNRMHDSLQLATASSIQIALFVAPLLVFASLWLGHPMSLAFPLFEAVAIGAGVMVLNFVSYDGESNWFEGALLVMVYLVIAAAFFFLP